MNGLIRNAETSKPERHEHELDAWLERDVVPAYDAYKADPARAKPLSDVMTSVRKRVCGTARTA